MHVDLASESPPPWFALESQQYPKTYALLARTFLCNCGGLVPTYGPSHRTSSCACEILPLATSRTCMPGCGCYFHRCQVGELELSTLRRGQSSTLNCEGAHCEDEAAVLHRRHMQSGRSLRQTGIELTKSYIFKYIYSFETDI